MEDLHRAYWQPLQALAGVTAAVTLSLQQNSNSSAIVHINLADSRPGSENRDVDIRERQTL